MSSLLTLVSVPGLLDLAIKSAAVMLLAAVVAGLLVRASAAWRHLVWCLGVAGLLLLPELSLALPAWRVAWLPAWNVETTSRAAAGLPGSVVPAPNAAGQASSGTGETIDLSPVAAEPTSPPATKSSLADASGFQAEATSPPRPWLAIVWAAGGLLSLVPLAVGLGQLAALHRRSRVIDDRPWLTLLDELRRRLAVRRGVQLRQGEAALAPMTWGALRPVLLVPAEADAWPEERRRLVLLHELAHIRRWDWLTQLAAHVACAMYWFNPLVWLAARQMRIERERACDDLVLATGARSSDYAQELLALAAGLSHSQLSTLAAVPMARRGVLEDRLRGILDSRRSRAALTTAAVCLGAALAAAALAPLAMLRAAPPESEEPKQEPTVNDKPAAEKAVEKPAAPDAPKYPLLGHEAAERIKKFRTSFGKAQEGIELGISLASDRKTFHEGERVPLEFVIRNVSQKTLHVEHALYPPETPPLVIGADGKQHKIEPIYLFGSIALYRNTLKPNEAAVYGHPGLGLGANPNPGTFWNPMLENVVAGKYALTQPVHITVREEGQDAAASFLTATGEIEFEIVRAEPAQAAEQKKPAEAPAPAQQHYPLLGKEAAERVKKFRPSYSKAQEGVEVGISLASDRKTFHEGERVPLEFVIRNVSRKTLHVEHALSPHETPPTVIGADGKQLSIEAILAFGGRPPDWNTLKPNEAIVYQHSGLGLGENPNSKRFWNPALENVVPGKFRLSQSVRITVHNENQDASASFLTATGEIEFEIVPPEPAQAAEQAAKADESPPKIEAFLDRVRASQRGPFAGDPIGKNDQGQIIGLALGEFQLRPGDSHAIGQLSNLSWLTLQRSNVQDADLAEWLALKNLKLLNLWDTKIGDAGVVHLAKMNSLQHLQLGGTGITDAGLESLARLTKMRELDLARTKVTDNGLALLAPLRQLESLKLAETAIGDAGLEVLDKLPALRGVTLNETQVTAAGIEKLAKRDGLQWMRTEQSVAEELARQMTAGDHAGVEAMLSIGLDLPRTGTFKTRSVVAQPVTEKDAERMRKRFRIEWDWKNDGRDEGLFAEIAVRQGTAWAIEAGVLEAVKPPPPPKSVTIGGKVVDDATDKPIGGLIVQSGKFEPADPQKVIWGYREERPSAADGSFSTVVKLAEGWTARIVADHYYPQPLLASAPSAGKEELEVTIRLVRVPDKVRGVVLDHMGKPLQGAAVYSVPVRGVNLSKGEAWTRLPEGGKDNEARPVRTDEQGRFELPTEGLRVLAVSHAQFDAWPATVPASGEITIRLPEPSRVEVDLNIEGAGGEITIFYQYLSNLTQEFMGVQSERYLTMPNPGKLTLDTLPPGKYQLCRSAGRMVDLQFFEVKPGETKIIDYVRGKGARVHGKVTWPAEMKVETLVVSILGESNQVVASTSPGTAGAFLTERIPPGTHQLLAYAFEPQTPERLRNTSPIPPSFEGQVQIEVPAEGELTAPDVTLKRIVRGQ